MIAASASAAWNTRIAGSFAHYGLSPGAASAAAAGA